MNNLKDSILEKLKVDDIILDVFPIDGTLEDIIKFLKAEGFKEYKLDNYSLVGTFNKNKGKIFLFGDESGNKRLWFANTSREEISAKNPVFLLIKEGDHKMIWRCFGEDYMTIFSDKNKVIDLLNKRFGWQ